MLGYGTFLEGLVGLWLCETLRQVRMRQCDAVKFQHLISSRHWYIERTKDRLIIQDPTRGRYNSLFASNGQESAEPSHATKGAAPEHLARAENARPDVQEVEGSNELAVAECSSASLLAGKEVLVPDIQTSRMQEHRVQEAAAAPDAIPVLEDAHASEAEPEQDKADAEHLPSGRQASEGNPGPGEELGGVHDVAKALGEDHEREKAGSEHDHDETIVQASAGAPERVKVLGYQLNPGAGGHKEVSEESHAQKKVSSENEAGREEGCEDWGRETSTWQHGSRPQSALAGRSSLLDEPGEGADVEDAPDEAQARSQQGGLLHDVIDPELEVGAAAAAAADDDDDDEKKTVAVYIVKGSFEEVQLEDIRWMDEKGERRSVDGISRHIRLQPDEQFMFIRVKNSSPFRVVRCMRKDVTDGGAIVVVPMTRLDASLTTKMLGQFFTPYENDFYYWQCYEIARRLVITGVVVAVDMFDDVTAVIFASVMCVLAISFQLHCKPFKSDALDHLMLGILFNQYAVQMGIVAMYITNKQTEVIGGSLLALQAVILSCAISQIVPAFRPVALALRQATLTVLDIVIRSFIGRRESRMGQNEAELADIDGIDV
ncbi:hypothetical protein CYMTET_29467 [Cymbomonas tetramitiformis]|uniref:Uncharacterized protein n=1 Tax=Cymbomonas tetramitiformis TaxID=36881 RepID=A0AAE0KUW4_9CHLO|nr:hypothetical protein CYMTET_29467 [Cymbomonas tetramitiformis]